MRKVISAIAVALIALTSASCASQTANQSDGSESSAAATAASQAGTRTVTHSNGTVEIPAAPQRIVSTSVVLTGTLLALDAPVVGSGGSKPNAPGLDSHGWFTHWASVAEERGVESLYTSGNLDLEAIQAADPDVIIVSANGGDSQVEQYDQLTAIAPTIVVDYNSQGWEAVTSELGEMLGLSEKADALLAEFDALVTESKAKIQAPEQPINIAVYSGDGGLAVGLPTAPQALLLEKLGITVADPGVEAEGDRKDFAFTSDEQAVQALTSQNLLLVGNDQNDVETLLKDARFASLPSVQANQVKPLGLASFKLDFYAAQDLVKHALAAYPK